ncbi:MAG: hypothetical protein LW860_09620 [Xanthomonadaceae bacterium]|nr:hypothetical protein [Xanthomonadaceae bacterium]
MAAQQHAAVAQHRDAADAGIAEQPAGRAAAVEHGERRVARIVALHAEPVAGDPDLATAIAQQRTHLVAGDAGRLVGVVPQYPAQRAGRGLAQLDAVRARDPQGRGIDDHQRMDGGRGPCRGRGHARDGAVDVATEQAAVVGADPQHARGIRVQRGDARGRCVQRHPLEARRTRRPTGQPGPGAGP